MAKKRAAEIKRLAETLGKQETEGTKETPPPPEGTKEMPPPPVPKKKAFTILVRKRQQLYYCRWLVRIPMAKLSGIDSGQNPIVLVMKTWGNLNISQGPKKNY